MKYKIMSRLRNKRLPSFVGWRCLLFFIFYFLFSPVGAQKVITRSTMVGYGRTNILDTYLSAEHFKGPGLSFVTTIERQRPERRWSTLMEHEANLSTTKNRAKSQTELEGAYNFYWGKLYSWQLFSNCLKLQAGGLVNASMGFIYNTSNGNNPAQARAHLNVMPTGVATYQFVAGGKRLVPQVELIGSNTRWHHVQVGACLGRVIAVAGVVDKAHRGVYQSTSL